MNRIEKTFDDLKQEGRKGLVGYLTAGDPDLEQSEVHLRAAIENGLDVLELGMPFSDPTADGPTIQAASHRALASGMNLGRTLELVQRLRRDYELPIVLFGYANPLFRYGYEKLCADAAEAGIDGLLMVDLPYEEAAEIQPAMDAHDLCRIPLVAPTTSMTRTGKILEGARGFLYYIMVKGVTGARKQVAVDVTQHVENLRRCSSLPIAVGFGVSNGEQARQAAAAADAVVVGSALVQATGEGRLGELVRELRGALEPA